MALRVWKMCVTLKNKIASRNRLIPHYLFAAKPYQGHPHSSIINVQVNEFLDSFRMLSQTRLDAQKGPWKGEQAGCTEISR